MVEDVATHFDTDRGLVRAVDGVSFTLERGKTLGIVGESGSGKTVLSRSIMGLLPKKGVVRHGSIRFEGTEIGNLGPKQMRRYWGAHMAMVFQDPMTSLNPVMKIGKQITESIHTHLDVTREYAERARGRRSSPRCASPIRNAAWTTTRISSREACASGSASRSRSRPGPQLLFADEPTTALDVTVQAQVLDVLETQQRERFMAMVLVTHDLGVVAGRTDDVIVMYAGQVVEQAPTATLFDAHAHALHRGAPPLDPEDRRRRATRVSRRSRGAHPTSSRLPPAAGSPTAARTCRTSAGRSSHR